MGKQWNLEKLNKIVYILKMERKLGFKKLFLSVRENKENWRKEFGKGVLELERKRSSLPSRIF